ncbi:MAG TPA: DUF881 domain-containing protein [Nocardioides sp.]|nr:DUF881 domain-containing protein [Nocardioides sp.]
MTESADRARTPLLALITQESLDRDYQVVASRRGPDEHEGPASRAAVIGVVAAFALLVTVAAVQTSEKADVNDASRTSLIRQIEERRDVVGDLQARIASLRSDNAAADRTLRVLGAELADAQATRATLGAVTGFEPVRGDGVRVTVDNAPYAEENDLVRDSDLALLVDALWQAGAEAIAINGQRLTAVSGIRTSGDAIEINSVGIAPPYSVLVIGDQRTLSANFVETGAGLQFVNLANQHGITYTMDNEDDMRLPAAPAALARLDSATYEPKKDDGGGPP